MKKLPLWIALIALLNILSHFACGLPNRFIFLDIASAIVLGCLITYLWHLFNKELSRYLKTLLLTITLCMIIFPFVLHFDIIFVFLEITIGSNPSIFGIYGEGITRAIIKSLIFAAVLYPLVTISYIIKMHFKK